MVPNTTESSYIGLVLLNFPFIHKIQGPDNQKYAPVAKNNLEVNVPRLDPIFK